MAAGRVVTVLLFVCSSALVFVLDTAKDAFDVILQVGAGTGLLYLVRWFWWRVNAWCEVVAMVSSFAVSLAILVLAQERRAHEHARRADRHDRGHDRLLGGDGLRRARRPTGQTLISFYRKVRPFGPGLGAHPQRGGRRPRRDAQPARQHPAGARSAGCRAAP